MSIWDWHMFIFHAFYNNLYLYVVYINMYIIYDLVINQWIYEVLNCAKEIKFTKKLGVYMSKFGHCYVLPLYLWIILHKRKNKMTSHKKKIIWIDLINGFDGKNSHASYILFFEHGYVYKFYRAREWIHIYSKISFKYY